MAKSSRLLRFWLKKRRVRLSPMQTIALVFAGIILLGTLLLTLPSASRDGQTTSVLDALFTATSATCVTGLVRFDTWSHWSGFGQTVILLLIEIGGLGFMSAASIVVFLFRRRVSLRQRMVMAQALSLNEMEGAVRLQKWVLIGSVSIQLLGALVLFLRFLPDYGLEQSAVWGIFHAVSAFCNAGFDIFGSIQPGTSVICLNDDPVVLCTLMVLIVAGGLGFLVWEELVRVRSFRKFSVYTKLVLLTTGVLILFGAALVLVLEWNNPDTLGAMPVWQKTLNAFFQSVTLRTAGFASVDQGGLTDASKAISMVLMLIGGSSGSTAGGLKTVSFIVILLFIWARARGRHTVHVFHRSVPAEKVLDAMTIAGILVMLAGLGAVIISATSPVGFVDALFETVSALGTVGLTTGITTALSIPAQILVIIFMYFGRVGVLTISLGFLMGDRAADRFQYAYTNLLIG
ncbi:MAG: potassium uptake protein, TrkH family [Oscillospiraceae bacterium]|nr:potassium uptake protein, TrkH family [Oscillospiraceae bacterium]